MKIAAFMAMYFVMIKLGEYFTVATDDILEVAEPVLYAIGLVTSVIYDFFLTLIVTRYDVFVRRFKKRNTNNNK